MGKLNIVYVKSVLKKDMKRLRTENFNIPEYSAFNYRKSGGDISYIDQKRFEILTGKFKGGKLIDIGCLNSPVCVEGKKKYPESEFWALDFAEEVIEDLKSKYKGINYVVADFNKTGLKDNYFDYIVAGEVLERTEDPELFLKEMFRILKKGGTLALSTPLEEEITEMSVSYEHLWGFTIEDIENLLSKYGKVETFVYREELNPKIIAICKYEN
jgi:ubiquinone/menaquinone biosynthesis C-methylase UbiE